MFMLTWLNRRYRVFNSYHTGKKTKFNNIPVGMSQNIPFTLNWNAVYIIPRLLCSQGGSRKTRTLGDASPHRHPEKWCFRKVKWCLNYAHKTRSFIQRLLLNCQNKLEYIQNTLVSEYTRVTSSNKIFKEHLIHICAKFLLSYVTTFQACNSLPEWVVPVYFKEKTIPLKNSYM